MKQIFLFTAIGFAIGIGYLRISEPVEFSKRFPALSSQPDKAVPTLNVSYGEDNPENKKQDYSKAQQSVSDSRHNAITKAIDRVYPSVVGVSVTSIQKAQSRNPFDLFYNRQRSYIAQSIGSGFIITADGYIVTNQHVIDKAKEISVMLSNGESYQAQKVGEDVQTDIALIKIINTTDTFIPLDLGDSNELLIGEWAIALGNPFGLNQYNNNPTVTLGIISAKGRDFGHIEGEQKVYYNMIQTDAAINSGNSGGPLVNALGEVIGMNTFIYTGGGASGNVGIAFAIPINDIMKTVEILKHGDINRNVYTGIYSVRSNSKQNAYYLGLSIDYGVIILQIVKDSPAHSAGLKAGDVIIEANGFKVNSYNDLKEAIFFSGLKVGDKLSGKYVRDSKEQEFTIILESN